MAIEAWQRKQAHHPIATMPAHQMRRRKAAQVGGDVRGVAGDRNCVDFQQTESSPRQNALGVVRYVLVWAARLLLPVVLVLSIAQPVIILDSRPKPAHIEPIPVTTAVLIFTHARPDYLNRTLNAVLTHHPRGLNFPVIVSQDEQHQTDSNTTALINSFMSVFTNSNVVLHHWTHEMTYPDPSEQPPSFVDTLAYRRISRHYKHALSRLFNAGIPNYNIHRAIILEDDMAIAPDFFNYFEALAPVLESDKSLMCISAWNDNGIPSLAKNATQLHRTDFFPGLGWMLTRRIWEEISSKWPAMFWDDWLRSQAQMKGRQCIRPEVSRTSNFGAKGVSQSFHFEKHVSKVSLSDTFVDFTSLNLSYLERDAYYDMFFKRMSKAVRLNFSNYLTSRPQQADVIAFYPEAGMEALGKRTGVMIDHREGVRRTSYHGVVVIPWNGHWAFLVSRSWQVPEKYALTGASCC